MHHGKYDYSRAVYNGAEEVEIICPIHGVFRQRAISHTSGYGCNKCAVEEVHNQQRKTTEQFVSEEAFIAYKQEKEAYLKEIADEYYKQGKIAKEAYLALLKYEVRITD